MVDRDTRALASSLMFSASTIGTPSSASKAVRGERAAQVLGVADLHRKAQFLVEQGPHGGALVVAATRQGEHARVSSSDSAVEACRGRATPTVVPG